MKKPNSSSVVMFVAMAAAVASLAAYRRRPVKQPEKMGSWEPVDSQRTRR